MDRPRYVSQEPLEAVLADLWEYANAGQAASRSAAGRAVMELQRLSDERDALQAMVDSVREIVAEHDGELDGDQPIDHVAAVVGWPEQTRAGGSEEPPSAARAMTLTVGVSARVPVEPDDVALRR